MGIVAEATKTTQEQQLAPIGPPPKATVVMPIKLSHQWQLPMTICALDTLACTTDEPFELIVVETGSEPLLRNWDWIPFCRINDGPVVDYRHIHLKAGLNPTWDLNQGLEAVKTEYTVYTGNDVFVREDWLEALLECFQYPECGIATLASADLMGTLAAIYYGQNLIREGFYGPFCMFKSHWRFDEKAFPSQFADSDLIMRVYHQGLRSYRNNRVVIQHLNRQTINGPLHEAGLKEAKYVFENRWKNSPHLAYRILSEGFII